MQDKELQDDAEVIIKLQRMSIGWMGFGIEPADASVNGMQDTDMYIGWISIDSTVTFMDAWSVGMILCAKHVNDWCLEGFMMPESDSDQGGENSILAYAGEEKDGVSTIVFKRKVNTGDPFDRVIKGSQQAFLLRLLVFKLLSPRMLCLLLEIVTDSLLEAMDLVVVERRH